MSKIVRNPNGSNYFLTDLGVNVLASSSYTIPSTDYLRWAASNDVITALGAGSLIYNDGTSDLGISDGTDALKGITPRKIIGGTDGTAIGNVGDKLKTDGSGVVQPVSGTFWQTTQPVSGTFWQTTQPVSGTFWQSTQPISAASLPLPTGASTAAKQDTGNTSLGSIDTKTPAFGQATMVASVPVVIASNQSAIPVSGTFWQATQPISGTVSISNFPATQAVTGTFWQSTQPISAAALPLPTGAATSALQTTGNTSLGSIDTKFPSQVSGRVPVDGSGVTQPVSGPLTDTQLRAASVPVVGPGTAGTPTGGVLSIQGAGTSGRLPMFNDGYIQAGLSALAAVATMSGSGAGSIGIQINGAFVGTVSFEATLDFATWVSIPAVDISTGSIVYSTTTTGVYKLDAAGFSSVRLRMSAYTSGTANITFDACAGTSVTKPTSINPLSLLVGSSPIDGVKATYSACITGLSPALLATDIFTIFGSASKVVKITHIRVSGTQTTSGAVALQILKRSTANTAGTSSAPAKVPHDSTSAAATATVLAYTANPTAGTLVGLIRSDKISVPVVTGAPVVASYDFGQNPSKAPTLRGVAEGIAVNLNGVTFAGSSFNLDVEWTEE